QPEVRLKTRALIPSCFVQENFGMSEGTLFFVRIGDPEDVRLETVGRPISPDDEVRLLDDDDNAKAFTRDGFYRSGDLMRRHPSGNYMVEGRKKDLINRGGEKISAEEIENLILSHRAVQNVACIAMPDPDLGER